ncbi:hypothetical protein NKH77_09175 [Streptomyces sp. M19]
MSQRFPDAISFAAGRPYEGYFDLADVHRYIQVYCDHVAARSGGDAALVRREVMQYGRTKGVIHELIARNLSVDEGSRSTRSPSSSPRAARKPCSSRCGRCAGPAGRAADRAARLRGATGAAELADMPLLPVKGSPDGIDLADLTEVIGRARAEGASARLLRRRRLREPVRRQHEPGHPGTAAGTGRGTRFPGPGGQPYGVFSAEDAEQPPTLKALDPGRRVVYLGSFAKTGIPGPGRLRRRRPASGIRVRYRAVRRRTRQNQEHADREHLAHRAGGHRRKAAGKRRSLRSANTRERAVYQRNLRHLLSGLAKHFLPVRHRKSPGTRPPGFLRRPRRTVPGGRRAPGTLRPPPPCAVDPDAPLLR